jgi:hypothetical protein
MGSLNQSFAALATPLSRLFKAQFAHTQFVLDTIWAHSESIQHFPEVTHAALTKILPGDEDRFGK